MNVRMQRIKAVIYNVKHTSSFFFVPIQHYAAASPYPKRKQVCELLLRKGGNVNEKCREYVTRVCRLTSRGRRRFIPLVWLFDLLDRTCITCVCVCVFVSTRVFVSQLSDSAASGFRKVPQRHHRGACETRGESEFCFAR